MVKYILIVIKKKKQQVCHLTDSSFLIGIILVFFQEFSTQLLDKEAPNLMMEVLLKFTCSVHFIFLDGHTTRFMYVFKERNVQIL